jgi:hypothetical protein
MTKHWRLSKVAGLDAIADRVHDVELSCGNDGLLTNFA